MGVPGALSHFDIPPYTNMNLDNAVSIHQRNPQYLMTEIYKTNNGLAPSFMRELFKPRDLQYNLRNKTILDIPKVKTTSWYRNSAIYWSKTVGDVPNVRESPSLIAFKKELSSCIINCDCRLCKTFIPRLGFI